MTGDLPSFDLRLVPSFQAVAEERNFGRAADRLRLAQPALSRQIAKLEEQLGATLLVRGSREATLTPAGETFLAACRDITEGAARAHAAARPRPRGGLVAHVGLGMTDDLTRTLRSFGEEHPEVGFEVLESSPSSGVDAVLSREADVGFEVIEGVPPELGYLPIHRLRVGVACAPDHPLARGERVGWTDLEGESLFLAPLGPGNGYNAFLRSHLRMFGVTAQLIDHPATHVEALMVAIGSGRAVLVIPAASVAPAVASNHLAWVLLAPLAELELGLVWDPARADPNVDRFVRWAAATMSSVA